MRKNSEKGFTLMEMLIVVAIIAVLIAIVIPIFSGSVINAKKAADMENVYAAYEEAAAKYLSGFDGTAETSEMQEDGKLTIDKETFIWDRGEIVTVTVDQDGVHQDNKE